MANAVKWSSVSSSDVSANLNSLADGSFALQSEFDNGTTKAQYGKVVLVLGSWTPSSAAGGVLLYLSHAPDGSNYDYTVSSNPGTHNLVISMIVVDVTATARRLESGIIQLQPFKTKLAIQNKSGAAFAGSGNSCTLYYWNDEIQ